MTTHSRPIPFSMPPEGWHRWNSKSHDGTMLVTLIKSGAVHQDKTEQAYNAPPSHVSFAQGASRESGSVEEMSAAFSRMGGVSVNRGHSGGGRSRGRSRGHHSRSYTYETMSTSTRGSRSTATTGAGFETPLRSNTMPPPHPVNNSVLSPEVAMAAAAAAGASAMPDNASVGSINSRSRASKRSRNSRSTATTTAKPPPPPIVETVNEEENDASEANI